MNDEPTPRRPFRPSPDLPPLSRQAAGASTAAASPARKIAHDALRRRLSTRGVPLSLRGDGDLTAALLDDLRAHGIIVHETSDPVGLGMHPWATHVLEGRTSVMREVVDEHVLRAPRLALTALFPSV